MRLGLIGGGPQAQRYLLAKNGGGNVVAQVQGRADASEVNAMLAKVDGVIVATHPDVHRWHCELAFQARKPVLCEKPLALTWADCAAIIDEAKSWDCPLQVAHTYLWREDATWREDNDPYALIRYVDHKRDYSVWLDWAPHALALLARDYPDMSPLELADAVCIHSDEERLFKYRGFDYLSKPRFQGATPMWLMLRDFMREGNIDTGHLTRVYRALFAKEQNGPDKE